MMSRRTFQFLTIASYLFATMVAVLTVVQIASHRFGLPEVFWALDLIVMAVFMVRWMSRLAERRREDWRESHGACAKCGYDLRASNGACPECGQRREPPLIIDNHPPPPATVDDANHNSGCDVVIAFFRDESEAHMASGRLDAEGIPSTILDGRRAMGMRAGSLLVPREDVVRAVAILKETPAAPQLISLVV